MSSSRAGALMRMARQASQAMRGAGTAVESAGAGMTLRAALNKSSSAAASVGMSARALSSLQGFSSPRASFSMGFAATPVAPSPPMPAPGNDSVRTMSSSDVTDAGDGEDESVSISRGSSDDPPDDDDEDEHIGRHRRFMDRLYDIADNSGEGPRLPIGINMKRYEQQDRADPFELLVAAKESFMRKDEGVIPISPAVREVMYQHSWDRLLVDCRRTVDRTTRGKKEAYTSMVAVGNMKGLFGLGLGVADTAQLSVSKAYLDSYNQLTTIPLYRTHTIYQHIDHDFHYMKMRLMPRPDGWGLKCNDLLYELCRIVGIKNISIKTTGRRKNKFFVAQCFLEALKKQSAPHDGIEGTGMYVREVLTQTARSRKAGATASAAAP